MRRNGLQVMGKLIGLVKPLLGYMVLAIVLGSIGNIVAIAIPLVGIYGLEFDNMINFLFIGLIFCGITRGVFRYAEQTLNHYIAFKLLAMIRHKIFAKLRELAPAKLEEQEKGNLISVLTSDIELLEVFYAHTISPIAIAIITSIIMTGFIGRIHWLLGVVALGGYVFVGAVIPVFFKGDGGEEGYRYRNKLGLMNQYFLDSIRGLTEILQFGNGKKRLQGIEEQVQSVENYNKKLKEREGMNRALTDASILGISMLILALSITLFINGEITFYLMVLAVVAMLSSFGPVVALSNLSNNLFHTIASGNRVLDLLEEEPSIYDVVGKEDGEFGDIRGEGIDFAYDTAPVLCDLNFTINKGQVVGIHGESGCGKSTILKLIMRFFEPQQGTICVNGKKLEDINTVKLRDMQSYVTQETQLFCDSIYENIRIAKEDATKEEIYLAARKASIHDFIMQLPDRYDTNIGELGEGLSGGERQRIGIARAFLHDAPLMMLDEPTSNLDSLNEGIILKALKESGKEKTIVLVSHRKSTLAIADNIISL